MSEMIQGGRTWFGTMTVAPERRYLMLCEAEQRVGEFSKLTQPQRYAALWDVLGAEITRYFKRVRKAVGPSVRIRYCLVSEPHADDFPHAHFLLTEQVGVVTYRQIREAWRWGFIQASLVKHPGKASWYVSKYLTKTSAARIRASLHYGAWRSATSGLAPTECNDPPPVSEGEQGSD